MGKIIWSRICGACGAFRGRFVPARCAALLSAALLVSCSSGRGYTLKKITEDKPFLLAKVEYPVFRDCPALNEMISSAVLEDYAEFAQSAEDDWRILDAIRTETGAVTETPPFEYFVSCDPVLSGGRYASVLIRRTADTGGAHANTTLQSFTFDRRSGNTVSVTDVCGRTPEELSEFCRAALAEKLIPAGADAETVRMMRDQIAAGTEALSENFADFTYDGAALTVYFAPYQVAAFSSGIQQVEIPDPK